MKTLALSAATLLLSACPSLSDELCRTMGELAYTIMRNRQAEVPLSTMLGSKTGNTWSDEATRRMVMAAFEEPSYQNPAMQQRAMQKFRNEVELECYKALGK